MRLFLCTNPATAFTLAIILTAVLTATATSATELPPAPTETIPRAAHSPKDLPPRALILCTSCSKELLEEVADQVFAHGGTVSILLPPELALVRVAPTAIATLSDKFPSIAVFYSSINDQRLLANLELESIRFVAYWNRSILSPATKSLSQVGLSPLSLTEGRSGDELRAQVAEELLNTHESIKAHAPSAVEGASLTVERFLSALQSHDIAKAEALIAFGTDGEQPRALLPKLLAEVERTTLEISDFTIRAVAHSPQQINVQLVTSAGLPTAELVLRPDGLSWKIVEIDP